jgi:hypothetical protein
MAFDPVSAALDLGGKLIERLWPDPTKQDAAKLELLKLQQSGELAQITGQLEINKVEAANSSVFVSGWRPFIGWCCGAGCAWNWILLPALTFLFAAFGHPVQMYPADLGEMMPLLLGMLGIGGLRTFEKIKGVAH